MLRSVLTWLTLTVLVLGQVSALANAKAPCHHINSTASIVENAQLENGNDVMHHGHEMMGMSYVNGAKSQLSMPDHHGMNKQHSNHNMDMDCCQTTCDCQANSCHVTSGSAIVTQLPIANIKAEGERSLLSLSIPTPPYHQSIKPPIIA